MTSYRICLFMPPGYTHSGAFTEVVCLLKHTFDSLAIPCDTAINQPSPDRTNIFIGANLAPAALEKTRCRYIVYQLEQLYEKNQWFSSNLARLLDNASDVWDFSPENVSFLLQRGIPARLVPIGYHPALELIRHEDSKPLDVLFYGSVNERRKSVLNRLLHDNRITTKVLFGVYGAARDEFIARARVILNIHYYETALFEAVRISYLLNNHCCVVSEESSGNPYHLVNVLTVPYTGILETCQWLCRCPTESESRGFETYRQFKQHYDMRRILSNALAQPPAHPDGPAQTTHK